MWQAVSAPQYHSPPPPIPSERRHLRRRLTDGPSGAHYAFSRLTSRLFREVRPKGTLRVYRRNDDFRWSRYLLRISDPSLRVCGSNTAIASLACISRLMITPLTYRTPTHKSNYSKFVNSRVHADHRDIYRTLLANARRRRLLLSCTRVATRLTVVAEADQLEWPAMEPLRCRTLLAPSAVYGVLLRKGYRPP